jgi:hypothetical protein
MIQEVELPQYLCTCQSLESELDKTMNSRLSSGVVAHVSQIRLVRSDEHSVPAILVRKSAAYWRMLSGSLRLEETL